LSGFFVSFLHLVSKAFNIPIPEHPGHSNPDEAGSSIKSSRYNIITKSTGDVKYSNIYEQ
jgi:hypothetical protein